MGMRWVVLRKSILGLVSERNYCVITEVIEIIWMLRKAKEVV